MCVCVCVCVCVCPPQQDLCLSHPLSCKALVVMNGLDLSFGDESWVYLYFVIFHVVKTLVNRRHPHNLNNLTDPNDNSAIYIYIYIYIYKTHYETIQLIHK